MENSNIIFNNRTNEAGAKRCRKCNSVLNPEQQFCSVCGEPVVVSCSNCGTVLNEERFCPTCGKQNAKDGKFSVKPVAVSQEKKKGILPRIIIGAIIGCVMGVMSTLLLWNSDIGKNEFEIAFPDIVYNSWCEISDDGEKMTLSGDNEWGIGNALKAVETINKELGFPQTLEQMHESETGRAENDRYILMWEFETDSGGLSYEISYVIKD